MLLGDIKLEIYTQLDIYLAGLIEQLLEKISSPGSLLPVNESILPTVV